MSHVSHSLSQAVNNSSAILVVLVTGLGAAHDNPDAWAAGLGFQGLSFERDMTVYMQDPDYKYRPGRDRRVASRETRAFFFRKAPQNCRAG